MEYKGPLPKITVQKLYIVYIKTIQNAKFVYILYKKIAQIKISYVNECTRHVHQIPTYSPMQKIYKLQTEKSLKLEMYVFCTYKQFTIYRKPIQLANLNCLCSFLCI